MTYKNQRFQHRMRDFIRETKSVLMAMLLKLLEYAEAEEVMQEAYFKVFIAIEEKKEIEPRSYLFVVAKNMAISRLRHKKIVKINETTISHLYEYQQSRPTIEQEAIKNEQNLELLEAVNLLPPICRQIFIMRKIEERSHSEIAEIMNISIKTVENHLTKGMLSCRKFLQARLAEKSSKNKIA